MKYLITRLHPAEGQSPTRELEADSFSYDEQTGATTFLDDVGKPLARLYNVNVEPAE